ncbi:MAG: hypothetical protein JNG90_14570, partial [Planctomycetaceae bacterium]|nr:hypothetical protein [Planctomycetaceae bacterium]
MTLDAQRLPEGRLDWRRMLCGLLIAGWVGLSALTSRAADEPTDEEREELEAKLETRVYQVADLCLQVPEYDFRGTEVPGVNLGGAVRPRAGNSWGGTGLSGAGGLGGTGGGMGGMGGGGMGGGMGGGAAGSGGGFFRVPDGALAQEANTAGAHPAGAGASAAGPVSRAMIEELSDAIKTSIAPAFWDELGGNGTIVPFGGRLIVTQTVPIHQQIDDLLKGIRAAQQSHRNVTIRATWAMLNAAQLATLGTKGDAVPQVVEPAALAKLTTEVPGFRGQISCFDGQTVHLVSGRARSQVLSAIPVVGGNEAGYQPVIATVQGGVVLQVTPQISADGSSAIIDVRNSVMQP